jgi:hypothetical protein
MPEWSCLRPAKAVHILNYEPNEDADDRDKLCH